MKILVIGSGGREHTLVWKIKQSPAVKKIYCAPGNGGISQLAECVPISATDIEGLLKFADKHQIDLTIVGPEAPLAIGIVDAFQAQGLTIFGPSQKAAELEGSKVFAKYLMDKYHIPTAAYKKFEDVNQAKSYIKSCPIPIVVKADGLAAGKGAIVCFSREEAFAALDDMMVKQTFGDAGKKVIIEEYLQGEEASVLVLTDGIDFLPLLPAQDHKPIFDGDKGPNTGGMGAYAPAKVIDEKIKKTVCDKIIAPTIKGMALEDRPYRGVLYAGLMITSDGPKVVEFNCRFGDPETQAILPLVRSDIVDVLMACSTNRIKTKTVDTFNKYAVSVVIASGGYPAKYQKGKIILGLDRKFDDNILIFHAGTKINNGNYITDGGRVLAITATADTIRDAIKQAYKAIGKITFDGAYYRKDIAFKALK